MIEKQKIAIADSNSLVREGILSVLKSEINFEIAFIVDSKEKLFDELSITYPDILILDSNDLKGFVHQDILEVGNFVSFSKILVITANGNNEYILKILAYGITHLLLKNCSTDDFLKAMQSFEKNEKYLCKEAIEILLTKNLSPYGSQTKETILTKKEIEITKLIVQGLTAKKIAAQCFLSAHTVNTHRKNIFKKLSINSSSELIMYAVKAGMIDTTEYYI